MDTKECLRCHKRKTYQRFSRDKGKKDGLRTRCRKCDFLARNHRPVDKLSLTLYNQEFATFQGKSLFKESKICNRCKNKKPINCFNKDKTTYDYYQRECIDCQKERRKTWYDTHRTEEIQKACIYSRSEKARLYRKRKQKEKGRERHIKRYSNPHNIIVNRLRCRIRDTVVRGQKSARTEQLLGCSFEEFKTYLESKFQPEMSWEKINQIHIDHIRPCSSFDLTKPEEQKKCFHYSNLQPLWATENLKKHNKW